MIKVQKLDGTSEEYNEQKIRTSATRVGVPKSVQDDMIREIRAHLYDGITTSEIFGIIKSYLGQTGNAHLASKYNLKEALAELGPSGYPFEKFVAAILDSMGYQTKINQIIAGKCVSHEIDVIAEKDGTTSYIEAKFHKNPSQRTDVRVTLYIHARYQDVSERHSTVKSRPWIVTNTRFSTDAITYAQCRKIKVTSWGYPEGEGIMDLIEKTHLHPVTILEGLTVEDKRRLTELGIVTCKQFVEAKNLAGVIDHGRLEQIRSIAKKICGD